MTSCDVPSGYQCAGQDAAQRDSLIIIANLSWWHLGVSACCSVTLDTAQLTLTVVAALIHFRSSLVLVLAPQSDLGTPRAEMADCLPMRLRTWSVVPDCVLAQRAVMVRMKAMAQAAIVHALVGVGPADCTRGVAMA